MDLFFVSAVPTEELTLSGPSAKLDPARTPARGDLAHVRLAGKVFVPHYAVPMERTVAEAAPVLAGPRDDAEKRGEVAPGQTFNVLDLPGKWAWGQIGEDGLVGYIPAAALRRD